MCLDRAAGESSVRHGVRSARRMPAMLNAGRCRARSRFCSMGLKKLIGLTVLPLTERGRVELQPERTPGRHPQMDQSQLLVHEVEIIMQAFAAIRAQKSLAGLFVVPGV